MKTNAGGTNQSHTDYQGVLRFSTRIARLGYRGNMITKYLTLLLLPVATSAIIHFHI